MSVSVAGVAPADLPSHEGRNVPGDATLPPVNSSAMSYVHYDEDTAELDITFVGGKIYRYVGVPLATYVDLLEAESKGTFFNEHIKEVFPSIEVKPRRR
jgi:hypothetical protein